MDRYAQGYTLVEVLLSVSLIGMVALVVVPDLAPTRAPRLEVAARELADAIAFARSEAQRTGTAHGVDIDTTQHRVRVFSADTATVPPTPAYDVYHPLSKQPYDLRLADSSFADVSSITRTALTNGSCDAPERVIFDAQGSAFCGDPYSSLYLQNDLVLTLDRASMTVSLQGATGRVTVR